MSAPARCSSAPCASISAIFAALACSGTKTTARTPRRRAAHAVAAPWLPVDAVTTTSGRLVSSTATAPRHLNAPSSCSSSRFSQIPSPNFVRHMPANGTPYPQAGARPCYGNVTTSSQRQSHAHAGRTSSRGCAASRSRDGSTTGAWPLPLVGDALHEAWPLEPRADTVREEADAKGDEAAEQEPLGARHVHELQAAEQEDRPERDPEHEVGQLHGEAARDQHAGNRARQQPGRGVVVDVAADHVADAGHPQQCGGVKDVGADDLRHGQRIDEHHHETEERAAADRREPDDEPEYRADHDREDLVAATQDERAVARLDAALDEGLREEAEPTGDERSADGIALDRLRRFAVMALDQLRDADARERERAGAEEHPERQPGVHGAEAPVANRAERLEDRAVEDVGADRVGRFEPEEDDQDRRHQRAAAHSREADDRTDQQARERELPGHAAQMIIPAPTVSFLDSSMRMNAPVSRFSAYGSTASGSESRRRTTPMSFSSRRSGPGTSSSEWMSVSDTSSSTIARTERVVCFTATFARGSSARSLIQQTRASSSCATMGGRSGSASRFPRETSTSSASRIVTDCGGTASSIAPSDVSTDSTRERSPDGSTRTSSPARHTPPATLPA